MILHHITQALKANSLFRRDVDYIVRDGQVSIVDEFTGRVLGGRRYSDGLHQALEAKEGVKNRKRKPNSSLHHFAKLLPTLQKACGNDRNSSNRGCRVS